jgi:methionyl-tRNA synthetase
MKEFLFYCIPPTPNGDLHLGHLAGPYLGADILARYLRQRGHHVNVVTGFDDFQSYVYRKALESGDGPGEIVERCATLISRSWRNAGIRYDQVIHTYKNATYEQFVQERFARLVDQGALVSRQVNHLFTTTGEFAYQGMVRGICAWCGAQSDGNICEVCSLPNDCIDLENPKPALGDSLFHVQECSRRFVPVQGARATALKDWHRNVYCNGSLRAYFETFWTKNIEYVSATHWSHWGLPTGLAAGEKIDVWLEMAIGLLFHAQALTGNWKQAWNGSIEIGVFFGFDNAFYTSILFPLVLNAIDPQLNFPRYLFLNHFMNLDGEKFSTSRGHAIWGSDFLAAVNINWARLYLASVRSEEQRSNFSLHEYHVFERTMEEKWRRALAAIRREAFQRELTPKEVPSDFLRCLPGVVADQLHKQIGMLHAQMVPSEYSLSRASRALRNLFDIVLGYAASGSYATEEELGARLGMVAMLSEIARPWMPQLDSTVTRRAGPLGQEALPELRVSFADRIYV